MRAIIIDDEPDCVSLLKLQLKMYCPQIEIIAESTQSEKGLKLILDLSPDLVFLDIEMPIMTGIQLLERLENINFAIIFVTAYEKYAVKAFRLSAIDFLLKPVDPKELIGAIEKLTGQDGTINMSPQHLANYKKTAVPNRSSNKTDKIALPYQNGVTFVEINTILYCEADNNYTKCFLINGNKHIIPKTLKDVQEMLEEHEFLRIHRQYIINLNQISKFIRGEGNYIILSNGVSIPVSRTQKERLIEKFGWL